MKGAVKKLSLCDKEKILKIADRYNVNMRYHRLSGARGFVQKTKHGYCILIDDRLNEEAANRVVVHELLHVAMGHLDDRSYLSTEEKEEEVGRMIDTFKGG